MCVYVAGEMGTVRFIGHVQFADGVWLGIELKKPGVFLFLNMYFNWLIKYSTKKINI